MHVVEAGRRGGVFRRMGNGIRGRVCEIMSDVCGVEEDG